MSTITRCRRCGGNIVAPSYPGDGAWPVPPMCTCLTQAEHQRIMNGGTR